MPGVAAGAVAVGLMRSAASPYMSPLQIATELTSPTQLWFVEVCGDSRLANKEYDGLLQENLDSWIWVGNWVNNGPLDGVSHDSAGVIYNDDAPQTCIYVGEVDWQYRGVIAEMTGAAVSSLNALLRRIDSGSDTFLSSTNVPTIWARLHGNPTIFRGWAYGVTGGVQTSPDLCLWARANGGTSVDANNPAGDAISAPASGEYTEATLTMPEGWNSSTGNCNVFWLLTPKGTATTLGELASVSSVIYHPADGTPGLVLINFSVGGSVLTTHFLDRDVFYPAYVETWLPMVAPAGQHILWIDMGTNGGNGDTEFAAHIIELIEYWRAYLGAQTPVVITTAYDDSTDAGEMLYVSRIYDAVRQLGGRGVLLLDTRAAMKAYAEGVVAGYYADNTHYNDTGVAALMSMVSAMTTEVVANGANHQGYIGTDLTTDPMQVGVEFELSGIGTVGSSAVVTVNGEAWGSTTCGSDGSWSVTNTPTVAMRGAGTDVDVVVTFGPTRATTRPTTIAAAA